MEVDDGGFGRARGGELTELPSPNETYPQITTQTWPHQLLKHHHNDCKRMTALIASAYDCINCPSISMAASIAKSWLHQLRKHKHDRVNCATIFTSTAQTWLHQLRNHHHIDYACVSIHTTFWWSRKAWRHSCRRVTPFHISISNSPFYFLLLNVSLSYIPYRLLPLHRYTPNQNFDVYSQNTPAPP